ncbi:hypothetical protein TNCV_3256291 [Trichonephila clavipes]|nr:hypothetical protein TNCV_3256291 [Trichonephila clavipes]
MRPWAEFCGLPMISDEGRVVNTPLVYKRVLFGKRKGGRRVERERERGDENREEKRREGEEPALDREKG